MPEMSILGWFHTIWGIAAILIGVYSLIKFSVIRSNNLTGKTYLILTLLTGVDSSMTGEASTGLEYSIMTKNRKK